MLNDLEMSKLETYFGFLKREKGFFVGRRLESELQKDEIKFLILFPSFSEKSKQNLIGLCKVDCVVLEYTGNIEVYKFLNQKQIKAVGIHDAKLGKAIVDLLKKDMEAVNKGGC